jgi:hypothetical protein
MLRNVSRHIRATWHSYQLRMAAQAESWNDGSLSRTITEETI